MKNKLSLALLFCAGALTLGTSALAQGQTGAEGKSILFAESDAKWAKGYTSQAKKQIEEAGWKFELATPERVMKEKHPVYIFSFASLDLQKGKYSDVWESLWEKVKAGAVIVFQPITHFSFAKISEDEALDLRVRGIEKTDPKDRTPIYLTGDWLKKPYDLEKEFKKCMTPAYVALPDDPEAWQILATQPRSSEEKNLRDPFILFRPYGKGFVVVMGPPNHTFSIGVLLANLYENREALRGKSL